MQWSTKRLLGAALIVTVLAAAGWSRWDRVEPVTTAQAQVSLPPRASVTVAEEAQVALSDVGRLPGTHLIYVQFADGGRCLATNSGDGDIDCDW